MDGVGWRRNIIITLTINTVRPFAVHELPQHPVALLGLLLESLVLISQLGGFVLGGTTRVLKLDDNGLEIGD